MPRLEPARSRQRCKLAFDAIGGGRLASQSHDGQEAAVTPPRAAQQVRSACTRKVFYTYTDRLTAAPDPDDP